MAQKRTTKKTSTGNNRRKSGRRTAKKPKVYIPAYKAIILCAVIITICMGLLLITTIKEPENPAASSIAERYIEKEDKAETEKKAQTAKKKETPQVKEEKKEASKKDQTKTTAPSKSPAPSPATVPAPAPEAARDQKKKAKTPETSPAPLEKTETKPLPPPAPAVEKSKYNFPPAKNGATIVIVIDDAGRSAENTKKYTDLPFPITIAVLPKLPQTKQCADTVRKAGKELILHQPMQAMNLSLNPGEGAIKEDMTRAEITATIRENIAELGSGVKGMNNHEGSLITANEVKIGIVLDTCMDLGIYFLDSRTTAETKAPQAALERDFEIFEKAGPYIDNDIDYDKMLKRLRETLDYANKHGKAIVIGHVDKSVKILPKLLADTYPEMKAAGYRFASPSMLK